MTDDSQVKLELSVYFNDRLLQLVPLELGDATIASSPAVMNALRTLPAKLFRMELRLVGDAESAVRDGCDQVNLTVSMTPWQQSEAGPRQPAAKISYGLDNHARLISTQTTIYDRDGNRVKSTTSEPEEPHNEPPEDSPHIVEE